MAQKNNADILLVLDAMEVAYTNPLIDSFCIVSGDSAIPLVGKLKSMGKFVLGISRSEVASTIFINACNEFQFLESVTVRRAPEKTKKSSDDNGTGDESALLKLIESILTTTARKRCSPVNSRASSCALRPDFNEKNYGCNTFGKLLTKLSQKHGVIRVRSDNYLNVMVSLAAETADEGKAKAQLTRENWVDAFREQLKHYKEDGFERINPSILKADIQGMYPTFRRRTGLQALQRSA